MGLKCRNVLRRVATSVVVFQGGELKIGWDWFVLYLGDKQRPTLATLVNFLLRLDELPLNLIQPLVDLAKLFPHRVDRVRGNGVRLGGHTYNIPRTAHRLYYRGVRVFDCDFSRETAWSPIVGLLPSSR
ncbi:hypothetical protein B296_00038397 [Ensete ventricosum]|uniref:Uncharacterized protein n=1 Tax=Ensete ventricosum TaxID=4639 RepID=A0A426XDT4_ENSVE|nr:hypothetical protein B296_00038397 [Ensete ventricosum]